MEMALVWYILLNLAIFGVVLLFVRAARARVTPHEPQDLEENALVHGDWERVRRERCLPSHCRRVIGQPPRPRKDVTCEVCAATFLDARLQRLLEGPLAPEPAAPEAGEGRRSEGMPCWSHPSIPAPTRSPHPPSEPLAFAPPLPDPGRGRAPRERLPGSATRRWALVRFGLGIGCTVAGTAVAAFGGHLWLIIPGYGVVLLGLALIASGVI